MGWGLVGVEWCEGEAGGGPHVFICGVSIQVLLCIFVYIGLSSLLSKCRSSLYFIQSPSICILICIDIKYFVNISSNLWLFSLFLLFNIIF